MILKIIVVLVAIVSVLGVIAMFTSDKYTLTRSIVIHRATSDVFDFLRFNRNQKLYSRWLSLDPNTVITLKGSRDGSPGAILAFESQNNKAGTGEWETKEIETNKTIDFELRFLKPFAFTANGQFKTEAVSATDTRVVWVYRGGMNWPMNFMLLFLNMDKLVGGDIQTSLETLKGRLEQREQPAQPAQGE